MTTKTKKKPLSPAQKARAELAHVRGLLEDARKDFDAAKTGVAHWHAVALEAQAALSSALESRGGDVEKLEDELQTVGWQMKAAISAFKTEQARADALGEKKAKLAGLLNRAVEIIVDEELDRDFGEPPTPRTLKVRALLDDAGFVPERCSFGAVVGRSGAPPDDVKGASAGTTHAATLASVVAFAVGALERASARLNDDEESACAARLLRAAFAPTEAESASDAAEFRVGDSVEWFDGKQTHPAVVNVVDVDSVLSTAIVDGVTQWARRFRVDVDGSFVSGSMLLRRRRS